MSSSSDLYWKTVNEMLRNDQIDFNQPISSSSENLPLVTLTFKNIVNLNERIQFAFKNFKEISRLEYEHNDGQPEQITVKHLKWAKNFIESETVALKETDVQPILNAQSCVSIGDFLLKCHLAAQNNPSEISIQSDAKRKALLSYLFGEKFIEEPSTLTAFSFEKSQCTQIIFESADVASAIDELIFNLSDRTLSSWRIGSVYVQESLRNTVLDLLTSERLNATYTTTKDTFAVERKQQNEEDLVKKFGGKFVCNNSGTICLAIDVPPKYIPTDKPFKHTPIAIIFFRTTKEALQLVKTTTASIWTENIEIFYEVATELNASIIWSNVIGVFDKNMPSLDALIDTKKSKSVASIINAKEKYAVHVLDGTNNIPKYLYISYGKTFAN